MLKTELNKLRIMKAYSKKIIAAKKTAAGRISYFAGQISE